MSTHLSQRIAHATALKRKPVEAMQALLKRAGPDILRAHRKAGLKAQRRAGHALHLELSRRAAQGPVLVATIEVSVLAQALRCSVRTRGPDGALLPGTAPGHASTFVTQRTDLLDWYVETVSTALARL